MSGQMNNVQVHGQSSVNSNAQLLNNNKNQVSSEEYYTLEFMKPNAFFMFSVVIAFHQNFTLFYFFFEILLFFYKGLYLWFAPHSMSVELVCLVFFLIINLVRFYLGSLGNRSETSIYVLFNVILAIVPFYTYAYFLFLQTYALKLEVIVNTFGWLLSFVEVVFGVISMLSISKQEASM